MSNTIDDLEAAKRCARAIASDICLYNAEKINEAIENDSFFELLKNEIEEGREYYRSKVTSEIYDKFNFFDRAIVDVILKSKGSVKSKIW